MVAGWIHEQCSFDKAKYLDPLSYPTQEQIIEVCAIKYQLYPLI